MEFLISHAVTVAVVVIVLSGAARAKSWVEERSEKRAEETKTLVHEGVVLALNNGGGEVVRRIVREEVAGLGARVAVLEAKRRK